MPLAVRSVAVLALAVLPAFGCTSLLGDFSRSDGALGAAASEDAGAGDATPGGSHDAPAGPTGDDEAAVGPVSDAAAKDDARTSDAAPPPPGQPVRIATGETSVHALAVDANNVYFTRFASSGDVKQLSLAGGAAIALGSGIDGATDLALDGAGSVYWVTVATSGTWQLFDAKIGVAGSARSLLSPAPSGAAHGVAVDASHVFVGQVSSLGYATVSSIPIGGGAGATLASGPGKLGSVRERGPDVVWTDTANGRVYSASKTAGGAPVAIATGMTQPSELVLAGDAVFWINHGATGSASICAGTVGVTRSDKPLASNLSQPAGIATDGALVFWTDAGTGELLSMNVDGTSRRRVAAGIARPGPVAVGATAIVWYDGADGSIWKLGR